jgi:hypothetical protein
MFWYDGKHVLLTIAIKHICACKSIVKNFQSSFDLLEKALKNNELVVPDKDDVFYRSLKKLKQKVFQ